MILFSLLICTIFAWCLVVFSDDVADCLCAIGRSHFLKQSQSIDPSHLNISLSFELLLFSSAFGQSQAPIFTFVLWLMEYYG